VGGLLAGTTAMFVLPRLLGAWLTVGLAGLVPAVLTVLIVYTKGWRRAFCIGALFPAGVSQLVSLAFLLHVFQTLTDFGAGYYYGRQMIAFQVVIAGGWLLMFATGIVAVALHLVLRRRPPD
jgi:hypothetical protein